MELLTELVVSFFVICSIAVVIVLAKARAKLQRKPPVSNMTDLPTISVCIPARNEAHVLSACLDRVLSSDYEKLEILVLDDESIDQTPTLIKSFAHAGVRFIAGKPLPSDWMGKNHALDTMAREASGDYILFLDVDVHVSTHTISKITEELSEHNTLTSFIPVRGDTYRASALFGHLRYLWDMLQVGLGGAASASASIWCVKRDWLLSEHQGFEEVRTMIRPELALAKLAHSGAEFYVGGNYGIVYEKRWRSQMESSERLIIPTMRQYGFKGVAVAIWISFCALILPALVMLTAASHTITALIGITVVLLAGYIVQWHYLRMAWQSRAWLGAALWWWVCLQEFVLIWVSLVRYTTKTVTWKGRSIHAQPRNDDYYEL